MSSVQIREAGAFIAPLLQTNQDGKVIGITSKGVFLLFSQKVVFLTSEDHDNPFMLHLDDLAQFPQGLTLNSFVQLKDRQLQVGEMSYDLTAVTRIVPEHLPQAKTIMGKGRMNSQLISIFQLLKSSGHQDSFIYIADALLNKVIPADRAKQDLWAAVQQLRLGVHKRDLKTCMEALRPLLGSGKGLTPSGDDLVAGYLLILNSVTHQPRKVDEFVNQLNSTVLDLARSRTTWISVNIIEAATLRLVDERIGLAARVLLGLCKMDPVTVARKLESFGNSSGVDTFTGMVAALLSA